MPVGFGFSVGDFVSGISLVRNLIQALQDSGGSSKEYLQLIAELRSLETAFIQVRAQYDEVESPAQRVALDQAVQACQESVDDFLKSITKYHHHLNLHGTKSSIRDAFRKIQWHLTKAEELAAFRSRVSAHVQSIQTILVTIQVSSMAVTRHHERGRDNASKDQTNQMSNVNHSLVLINKSFDALRENLVNQGAIAEQTLASVDAIRHLMIAHSTQQLAAIQQLTDSLPPQILLQKPVIFLDALNRVAPIHLEWISSWEAFLAVLELRFEHLGRSKIQRKEFVLQETSTRRTIALSRPLDICLTPGSQLDMSMIFRNQPSEEVVATVCPHCQRPCDGSTGEEVECPSCNCYFHRIQQQDDVTDLSLTSQEASEDPSPYSRPSGKRSRFESVSSDDEVHPSDFKRLRLMYFPRWMGGDTSANGRPGLTSGQADILEAQFQVHHKPSSIVKRQIAMQTNLTLPRVANWFQNRRAKHKWQKKLAEWENFHRLPLSPEQTKTHISNGEYVTQELQQFKDGTGTPIGENERTLQSRNLAGASKNVSLDGLQESLDSSPAAIPNVMEMHQSLPPDLDDEEWESVPPHQGRGGFYRRVNQRKTAESRKRPRNDSDVVSVTAAKKSRSADPAFPPEEQKVAPQSATFPDYEPPPHTRPLTSGSWSTPDAAIEVKPGTVFSRIGSVISINTDPPVSVPESTFSSRLSPPAAHQPAEMHGKRKNLRYPPSKILWPSNIFRAQRRSPRHKD